MSNPSFEAMCEAVQISAVMSLTLCVCGQALPLHKLSITEKVVQAVQSMLLPQEGSLSIHTSLPASGDGSSPVMAAVRLLAEIRTRSDPQSLLFLFVHYCMVGV